MEFFLRKIYPWMIEVTSYSVLLPFIAACIFMFSHKSRLFKLLFLYIFTNVAIEATGQIVIYLGAKSNLWVVHLGTVIEFLVLSALFYHIFSRSLFKRSIVVVAVVFTLYSIWNAFYGEGITQMNSNAKMIENSLLISVALLYFYKVANELKIRYLDQDPVFLLCSFLIIYKAGTSMSYAMFNAALAESYDTARMCIAVMLVLLFLYNISLILVLKRTPLR